MRPPPWKRRSLRYPALGAALALGAPLGWLGLRLWWGQALAPLTRELADHGAWYGYLLLGTVTAFALFGLALGTLSDRLLRLNERLEQLAVTDALTSLKNARYFHERLKEEAARAERDGRPLALLLLDLDLFKDVNDRFGHPFGDRVLEQTARLIVQHARQSDVACRIGGEEFALICPGASLPEAEAIAERIRRALEEHPVLEPPNEATVTVSIGVASAQGGASPASLIQRADAALYASKRAGRNRSTTDPQSALLKPGG